MTSTNNTSPNSSSAASVGEVVQFVRTYARQETIGPLRGAGRWLAFGTAGSLMLSIGSMYLLLGLLRLLQTELFTGRGWSFAPYLIVGAVGIGAVATAANRISKKYLYKEDRP